MKFLQIHTFYDAYLTEFYSRKPELTGLSFNDQIDALIKDGFSGSHMVAPYLADLGYETSLVIANCFEAQTRWLQENQVILRNKDDWMMDVAREQVDAFKPNVLYLSESSIFDSRFVDSLTWKPALIVGWWGSQIREGVDWNKFDVILANAKYFLDNAFTLGAKSTRRFAPGIPEFIADANKDEPKRWDVVFSGQWTEAHLNRNEYLKEICEAQSESGSFSLGLFIHSPRPELVPDIVTKYNHGERWGIDMHRALKNGRIVINAEVDITRGEAGNIRLFEVTGSGSFLLTEYHPGVEDYFEPGVEIETFASGDELIEKIYYYLENPEKREAIAKRGHERCMRDYSMKKRVADFDKIIRKYVSVDAEEHVQSIKDFHYRDEEIKSDLDKFKLAAEKQRFHNYRIKFCDLTINCTDLLSFYMAAKDIFLHKIYSFETSKSHPRIIDGGGHIGLFTLFTKQRYPGAQITVFEPDYESFKLLNLNINMNGVEGVDVVHAGLHNCKDKVSFGSDNSDGTSIFAKDKTTVVDVVKLSDYIDSEIDFLKLNIEGSEFDVISEVESKLNFINELVIEYHGFKEAGQNLHEILGILDRAGFRYMIHDFDNETNNVSKPPFHLDEDTRFFLLIYAKKLFEPKEAISVNDSVANDLKSTDPVSRVFGFDRGVPVDRYYIDGFLEENMAFIFGNVLEIGDSKYTEKYGSGVIRSDVLNAVPANNATIAGDLASGDNIPVEQFDCIIMTQTIQFIYDVRDALCNVIKALKPGGVLLMTVPGISQISRFDMDRCGEYWRFTDKSLKMLMSEFVDDSDIYIQSHGNVTVAKAFLDGLATHELGSDVLDFCDDDYQLILTVRVKKGDKVLTEIPPVDENLIVELPEFPELEVETLLAPDTISNDTILDSPANSFSTPLVLLYHRVWDDPIDSQLLSVSPENFESHLKILSENYRVLPLRQLLVEIDCGELKPDTVSLTFDDGYLDVLTNAVPLLEKYGLHATVFVVSGMVGSDREFWWDTMERIFLSSAPIPTTLRIDWLEGVNEGELLTQEDRLDAYDEICGMIRHQPYEVISETVDKLLDWAGMDKTGRTTHRVVNEEQLKKLASSPSIEIGSHSVTHVSLSALKYNEQSKEMEDSRNQLESMSNKMIRFFSYPFGTANDFTADTMRIVEDQRYSAAIANIQGNVVAPVNMFSVPRRLVRNWSADLFAEWLKSEDKGKLDINLTIK